MTTTFIVRPEALPAWNELGAQLTDLAEVGRTTPCTRDPWPFVSDKHTERRLAAYSCTACPVVSACAAFADANAEPAHVWGGQDRTTQPKRHYQRKAAS